jgi:hypothetical protein
MEDQGVAEVGHDLALPGRDWGVASVAWLQTTAAARGLLRGERRQSAPAQVPLDRPYGVHRSGAIRLGQGPMTVSTQDRPPSVPPATQRATPQTESSDAAHRERAAHKRDGEEEHGKERGPDLPLRARPS